MSELRQYSLQQSKSLRWISILLAAILIAVGIHSYVLIRRDSIEQSLSTELKEMRKMVEELSSKVAKTEAENENLREELSNTEVKLANLYWKFPDLNIRRTWASLLSPGKLTTCDCSNFTQSQKVIV